MTNSNSAVNTITTTTGTALNVANTTIGASGLTFRSISANGAAERDRAQQHRHSGRSLVTGRRHRFAPAAGGTILNTTADGFF